jgi:hypothetical protein
VHQEPDQLRVQGRAATGGPRRPDTAQGVGLFGRTARRGEMSCSSHHRRAIASIACRSKANQASRRAGCAASTSLKGRKGLRCCSACPSARAKRSSPQ